VSQNEAAELKSELMDTIPVIALADLAENESARRELDAACREWGFFQITRHGIDPQLIEDVHRQTRAFFSLPGKQKQEIVRTAENVWGYYDKELTKNALDWKEIFDVGPAETCGPVAGATPQWPEALAGFKETMLRFSDACMRVSHRLMAAISSNMGLEPEALGRAFRPDTSFLRLNYYPVGDPPVQEHALATPTSGHLGIHHHTDAGALTVLLQDDQPSLQVYRDGAWHTVEPRSDALVINIGDIVQVWSNDVYRAPLHRVLASVDVPRYSIPFFFNPSYATDYAPLPSMCTEDSPPRYRPINWGEFRAGRAAGDYADYGEEIQIAHYRI
jgi:isopenicillin N synthase-like dioxygenase